MKRIVLSASMVSLLSIGCGQQAVMQPKAAVATTSIELMEPWDLYPDAGHDEPQLRHGQQEGDFVVYRFSGSYRSKPVTLSQKVIERDGDHIVIDMHVDDGSSQLRLRLRMLDTPDGHGELVSVGKLEGNVLRPYGLVAYEKLINDIVLAADANEGAIGTTGVLVDAGNTELIGTKTSYRVRVGAHEAVMSTMQAEGFAWGDAGAEIRTEHGKVLYKAEIVDMGGRGMSEPIAVQEEIDVYEGLDIE